MAVLRTFHGGTTASDITAATPTWGRPGQCQYASGVADNWHSLAGCTAVAVPLPPLALPVAVALRCGRLGSCAAAAAPSPQFLSSLPNPQSHRSPCRATMRVGVHPPHFFLCSAGAVAAPASPPLPPPSARCPRLPPSLSLSPADVEVVQGEVFKGASRPSLPSAVLRCSCLHSAQSPRSASGVLGSPALPSPRALLGGCPRCFCFERTIPRTPYATLAAPPALSQSPARSSSPRACPAPSCTSWCASVRSASS